MENHKRDVFNYEVQVGDLTKWRILYDRFHRFGFPFLFYFYIFFFFFEKFCFTRSCLPLIFFFQYFFLYYYSRKLKKKLDKY